ncbi:MAG TPA: putative cytokinetic ring protein SteA, partial [Pseudonocardiaceae bacterium]|nr:putative cytokinetic ring protein SteA [Pseudonocardiaceae bacterium]
MKISGLLSRSDRELPGVTGLARVERRADALARRVGVGDIAVFDQVDLDRRTADALVAAGVSAVINAAPSISGRFPNLGPEILVSAGIVLIDGVGADALRIKDGSRLRLHEGGVYVGETEVARGVEQDVNSIADLMIEAKSGLSAQLEAFSANTIEFLRHERALIIDRVGVPDINVPIRGRQVLVVAAGYNYAEDLAGLKHFIREYHPVLIGVEAGADALRAAGHRPHLIVGDPYQVETDTLKSADEVVVPAQPDGFAPGLERIQDLGIGAVTFPAVSNPEDLALLLAEAHG